VTNRFRLALMVNGMDLNGKLACNASCVHSDKDIADSANAVRGAVHMLKEEGILR